MNLWEKVTGSDMRAKMSGMDSRAKRLPADFHAAWEKIGAELWQYSDFTGRNLMPILDGVLSLLEEAAADGERVQAVLGDDIEGFCSSLASAEGALSLRDRWRRKLNQNVAQRLDN